MPLPIDPQIMSRRIRQETANLSDLIDKNTISAGVLIDKTDQLLVVYRRMHKYAMGTGDVDSLLIMGDFKDALSIASETMIELSKTNKSVADLVRKVLELM